MNTTRLPALRSKSDVDACHMAQFRVRLDTSFPVRLSDRAPCATKAARRSSKVGVATVALATLAKKVIKTIPPRDREILVLSCSGPVISQRGPAVLGGGFDSSAIREIVWHHLHWLVIAAARYSLPPRISQIGQHNCIVCKADVR